jgi:hypothetical protein
MFSPIILAGRYTTQLDLDNDAINEAVMLRKDMKLDDTPGNTFQEDSFFPETGECAKLIMEVDKIIQQNINPYFSTYNQWAHILEPKEQTMIHTHDNPGSPSHLSWVYYSKTDPECGNIVWKANVHNKIAVMEETPKEGMLIIFPNWIPHFTKKNNSSNTRISISGNAKPEEKNYEAVGREPKNLFDIIGILQ